MTAWTSPVCGPVGGICGDGWLRAQSTGFVYLFVFFIFSRAASASGGEPGLPRAVTAISLELAALGLYVFRESVFRSLSLNTYHNAHFSKKSCIYIGLLHNFGRCIEISYYRKSGNGIC